MKMVAAAKYARAERALKPARVYGTGALCEFFGFKDREEIYYAAKILIMKKRIYIITDNRNVILKLLSDSWLKFVLFKKYIDILKEMYSKWFTGLYPNYFSIMLDCCLSKNFHVYVFPLSLALYEKADIKAAEDKNKHLIIGVSSDRGLCGAIHSSVAKTIKNEIAKLTSAGKEVMVVNIGDKLRGLLYRFAYFLYKMKQLLSNPTVQFCQKKYF